MAFGVMDKRQGKYGKILTQEQIEVLGFRQRPNGILEAPQRCYGSHQSTWIAYVNVSDRYAVLNKVGCG